MNNNITFHCKLVIQNDEEYTSVVNCFVTHVMNRTYHDWQGRAYSDQRKARVYVLSEFLKHYIEETTDAGNEYRGYSPMAWELILEAIQEIDFRSIAEDLIGDYSPKSPTEVADNEEFFQTMGFGNYDIDED